MTEHDWRDEYIKEVEKQGHAIHYYVGSIDEYMPKQDVIALIRRAETVSWVNHTLDYDLRVRLREGGIRRLYRFDVRSPWKT